MTIIFAKLRLLFVKMTKPIRAFVLWVLLDVKQREAIWRQKQTGVTYYVVVTTWYHVYCFSKPQYDSIRKMLMKKTGKDLARNVKWRVTGTLVRNPDYCPSVEHVK